MARKKQKKIIKAEELISLFIELDNDLKTLTERKKILEDYSESIESLRLLSLFESKIEKRKKYLKALLETRITIS